MVHTRLLLLRHSTVTKGFSMLLLLWFGLFTFDADATALFPVLWDESVAVQFLHGDVCGAFVVHRHESEAFWLTFIFDHRVKGDQRDYSCSKTIFDGYFRTDAPNFVSMTNDTSRTWPYRFSQKRRRAQQTITQRCQLLPTRTKNTVTTNHHEALTVNKSFNSSSLIPQVDISGTE